MGMYAETEETLAVGFLKLSYEARTKIIREHYRSGERWSYRRCGPGQ